MAGKIILGPLLGFEGNGEYTVCILTTAETPSPELALKGSTAVEFERIEATPSGVFWRAVFEAQGSPSVEYSISASGDQLVSAKGSSSWKFYIPQDTTQLRMAYASCNGFSSGKLARDTKEPQALWRELAERHEHTPFSLLLLGGDQVYADSLWTSWKEAPSVCRWAERDRAQQLTDKATPTMEGELNRFYEKLYIRNWGYHELAEVLATIPSAMMWDDHDIFDGWGSYSNEMLDCSVYRAIFRAARKYFRLFQLRSTRNKSLFLKDLGDSDPIDDGKHHAWSFRIQDTLILALDLRSARRMNRVMSDQQWDDFKNWMKVQVDDNTKAVKTVLVLSSIPVQYREFVAGGHLLGWSETLRDQDNRDSLDDDLHDHWRHASHEGERMRLIQNLFQFHEDLEKKQGFRPTLVILSGDVHVGALGLLEKVGACSRQIHQIISSGIVHPPPSWFEWMGVWATSNDNPQSLEGGSIRTHMLRPYGGDSYLRTRNFTSLERGSDDKLWVTWICEEGGKPEFPIA